MSAHPLDNPIWASLDSRHAALALRRGDVARYPAPVAPFLGVAAAGIDAGAALEALVAPADSVFLLGPTPGVPEGWQLQQLAMLAQMVCLQPITEVDGPEILELTTDAHRADVLALTALVYPHYFRPRTMELGRYFGIYMPHGGGPDGGGPDGDGRDGVGAVRLAAIIGERMGMDDWQEISAVCTHPDFNGRGYARRLLGWLSNDVLARGRTPFLHVSHDNARAKQLYEQAGYHARPDIAFWSLRRA